MADLATFVGLREEPTGPVETYVDRALERDRDPADVHGGRRLDPPSVRQRRPRRRLRLADQRRAQELAPVGDRRRRRARPPGTRRRPTTSGSGHRDRPNEILLRNPALMGAAGRTASALPGGHVEGFGDTFGALFRAIYADVLAGRPSERPPYATFADGHDEMLVNDAIAASAAEGRWADGRSTGRERAAGHGGGNLMRLGFLTAPFPETPLLEVADWAAVGGLRGPRDRLLAEGDRADPPLRRHQPHRRREPVRRRGPGHPRARSRPRASRSPASASTRTRSTRTRSTGRPSSRTSSS